MDHGCPRFACVVGRKREAQHASRKKGSMGFLWFVVIGAVTGWYVGRRGAEGPFGPLGDIVAGTVGGLIGGFAAGIFGFTGTAGVVVGVLMAGAVAVALVLALRKYTRRNVHAAARVRDKTGRLRRS
jgi:uncharacterized membrane protein YeaQ/YmgE (transglycosylase-associated protein family)